MKKDDKEFEEKEGTWSDEELAEVPKSPKRFSVWVEDRYMITENAPGKRTALKENNFYCPVEKGQRCMCEDFKDFNGECVCAGEVYKKTLRDEAVFLKMRRKSFKRGE